MARSAPGLEKMTAVARIAVRRFRDVHTSAMSMSRRSLLRRSALILGGVLAASADAQASAQGAQRAVISRAKISSLSALRSRLKGRLLLPNSPSFVDSATPFDTFFDFGPPVAIVEAKSDADVVAGIDYARTTKTPIAVRSGGHNYAGYSTTDGLLISVAQLNKIKVDAGTQHVTVGAGTLLGDLYAALAAQGQMVPAGTCPTVGVAGHVYGGGFGLHARKYGLLADNLVSVRVALANGRLVTASPSTSADLFWAIRGGGGGNLGYATSFTFRTHPVGALSAFKFEYPWTQGRQAFSAWQGMIPSTPDGLTMGSALLNNGVGTSNPGAMGVQVFGVYHGPADELQGILEPLTRLAGPPAASTLKDMSFMEQVLFFGNCESLEQCKTRMHLDFYAKSAYVKQPYGPAAVEQLFAAVEQWPGTQRNCMIESFSYGGAVNSVPSNATAFPHRDQLFCSQQAAYFGPSELAASKAAAVDWLNGLHQTLAPYGSGGAFINYIDADQQGWQQAYYGSNLAKLKKVRRRYDPDGLFRFPQSIP